MMDSSGSRAGNANIFIGVRITSTSSGILTNSNQSCYFLWIGNQRLQSAPSTRWLGEDAEAYGWTESNYQAPCHLNVLVVLLLPHRQYCLSARVTNIGCLWKSVMEFHNNIMWHSVGGKRRYHRETSYMTSIGPCWRMWVTSGLVGK